jgi:hypothetical protein
MFAACNRSNRSGLSAGCRQWKGNWPGRASLGLPSCKTKFAYAPSSVAGVPSGHRLNKRDPNFEKIIDNIIKNASFDNVHAADGTNGRKK